MNWTISRKYKFRLKHSTQCYMIEYWYGKDFKQNRQQSPTSGTANINRQEQQDCYDSIQKLKHGYHWVKINVKISIFCVDLIFFTLPLVLPHKFKTKVKFQPIYSCSLTSANKTVRKCIRQRVCQISTPQI